MQVLAVSQKSVFKARIDEYFVGLILKIFELTVSDTESPVVGIIRRTIRDQIRLFRERMKMFLELRQRTKQSYKYTIADDVQVGLSKIVDPSASLIF